jgi:hypothetical protein
MADGMYRSQIQNIKFTSYFHVVFEITSAPVLKQFLFTLNDRYLLKHRDILRTIEKSVVILIHH